MSFVWCVVPSGTGTGTGPGTLYVATSWQNTREPLPTVPTRTRKLANAERPCCPVPQTERACVLGVPGLV